MASGEQVASEAVGATLKQFKRLDVLVNNAGITALTKFDEPNCLEVYHKTMGLNMHAVVFLCLAAFPALKESRGSIVNVSSCLDDRPANYKFAYCMSKAAITMLTKCLANDFSPFVRVNASFDPSYTEIGHWSGTGQHIQSSCFRHISRSQIVGILSGCSATSSYSVASQFGCSFIFQFFLILAPSSTSNLPCLFPDSSADAE